MKLKIFALIPFLLMTLNATDDTNIFDINLTTIEGDNITLDSYSGDVLLIVNTASKCGFTPQYKELQKLHEKYSDRGLRVLGFPAGNFGDQELDTDDEIVEFCEVNYGVEFPLFSKISVKGDDIHPLFKELTTLDNEDFTGDINWNFEKFLIDRNGKLVRRFRSKVEPMSDEIVESIENIL